MLEEQTTTERPDYASMTLEELAASANENSREVARCEEAASTALGEAVRKAMDAGDALLAAKAQIEVGWQQWVIDNYEFELSYASRFMRLAEHRPHVERWILEGGDDGSYAIRKAYQAIGHLPSRPMAAPRYPVAIRKEAKRLHSEGVKVSEIADLLDVKSNESVRSWVDPKFAEKRRKRTREANRRMREGVKALKEKQEREERARLAARADDTGKAYSEVRKLTAALSQAIAGVDSAEARNHLREAERLALKAEESIVAALKELRTDG